MNLENLNALVTGASRGIGASIVEVLASFGCDVIINYNNSEKEAYQLEEYIKNKYNVKVLTIKADVSNETEVKNMIEQIISEFGKLDILVNNAGIAIDTLFVDKTKENFKKILDVNLIGTFLVSKYASKYMLENKFGRIINISSTNGIDTFYPMSLDYDASKAGVISLTKNFAKELAPYINVNAIASGWVNTETTKDLDKDFYEEEVNKIFMKRFAEPEEIANVVLFLASPLSTYVNGEVIRVDGGF